MEETKKKYFIMNQLNGLSLPEVNNSVEIPEGVGFWRKFLAYSGPGALVAVGYMDPGNWVTSIAGGSQFGYLLLSVILLSSIIAMILQYMSAKLGIVTGLDLAQATRMKTNRSVGIVLWIITELAIMATDIAEVIGSAVALNLLFKIPILLGVFITVLDVFLLLMLAKLGFRKIEAIVVTLILTILLVFSYEVALGQPEIGPLLKGFLPNTKIITDKSALFIALGIIGATVMPHNLYLHSSIVQSRRYNREDNDKLKEAIKFARIDSNLQLSVAFVINCLLLILGASLFFGHGDSLNTLGSLYRALSDKSVVGNIASPVLSILFAVALLASGQNSTITGTLSGQIVMEGFIKLSMPVWARRLLTRVLAVTPVIIAILVFGDTEEVVEKLLIYTQVFLSLALPVSVIPLTLFTSDSKIMGEFVNKKWLTYLAWVISIGLIILNINLVIGTLF